MKKGRAGTMTHDYKRHGTTTLFAALNVATGEVVGECFDRHRHDEFLVFLKKLDRQAPRDLDLHLIVDNYATHKHPDVQAWLAKHPRVHLHFTPTSASWLNLVERFFAEITQQPYPPRRLQERRRTGDGDQRLPRPPQPSATALCLDRVRRQDPRQGRES